MAHISHDFIWHFASDDPEHIRKASINNEYHRNDAAQRNERKMEME